jgi:VIT1/CCC1 family predicted Fe2+/Mn2+ transporter
VTMANRDDVARYRANLKEERNAVVLYERMARAETNDRLKILYGKLADTERKHASVWEGKLRSAGAEVPAWRTDGRTRILGWLADRFGVSFVLPTVAGIEQGAATQYDGQAEVKGTGMAAEERSHARIFRMLAGDARGLDGGAVTRFEGRHPATGGNALRAGVLGANDGLVSILSLVMGVAGASMDSHAILITGLAGLLAGSISMALGEWLSVQSSRELFARQLAIEKEELEQAPEEEHEELALIYQAKGLAPEQARELAGRLLQDPVHALDTLSREELGMDPKELGGSPWEAAFTSFMLFAAGAIPPVIPFLFTGGMHAVIWSGVLSAVGLFVIGAGITLVTGRSLFWSGVRQVIFGLGAAAITFGIGRLLGVQVGG